MNIAKVLWQSVARWWNRSFANRLPSCGTLREQRTIIGVLSIVTFAIILTNNNLNQLRVTAQPNPTATPAPSAISGKTLTVATRVLRPFVTEDNGELGGFSIELWQRIAQELGIKSEFKKANDINGLLDLVKSTKTDLGIAAISVTSKREQDFDFSQPIFESGLQILVRSQGQQSSIRRLLSSIFNPTLFQLLGLMIVILLIPAHIIWLVERNHNGGFLENSNYFPGIFKACWWAAATLATQAEEMPKGPLGRLMAVIWMFISVVFIAYFTATVTTSLTVEQLQSNIKGLGDLADKKVATIAGSTAETYLKQQRIEARAFKQVEQTYEALNNAEVDAVVYDAPILLYYAAHDGKGKVQVVGSIFRKEGYAIALPNGSPYRKPINNALLSLQEKGTYQEIYDKWFASK
jgi:polar amino acid transport system substrate-binding protein